MLLAEEQKYFENSFLKLFWYV